MGGTSHGGDKSEGGDTSVGGHFSREVASDLIGGQAGGWGKAKVLSSVNHGRLQNYFAPFFQRQRSKNDRKTQADTQFQEQNQCSLNYVVLTARFLNNWLNDKASRDQEQIEIGCRESLNKFYSGMFVDSLQNTGPTVNKADLWKASKLFRDRIFSGVSE